ARGWRREVGGSLLLSNAASGRTRVLGRLFRSRQGSGRSRAGALPRSERRRTVGVRRLRLLGTSRSAALDRRPSLSAGASRSGDGRRLLEEIAGSPRRV